MSGEIYEYEKGYRLPLRAELAMDEAKPPIEYTREAGRSYTFTVVDRCALVEEKAPPSSCIAQLPLVETDGNAVTLKPLVWNSRMY
jgi:hypothetical protein